MEKNKVKKKEIGEQKVLGDESEGSIGSNSRIFGKTPRERDILESITKVKLFPQEIIGI